MYSYIYLFYYFFVCFFFVFILLFFSILFVKQNPDLEKLSSYECGFNPYEDVRSRFEVKFFLVGLLFIVFDLEVAFLLPWVLIFEESLGFSAFFVMFFFLFFLAFSFFFEWWHGAFDWV